MNYLEKLRNMEEKIVNGFYLALIILFLPMMVNIYNRIKTIGIDLSAIMTFVLMLIAIFLFLMRKHVSLTIRIGYISVGFLLNGFFMLFAFGLAGIGFINIIEAVVISALFQKRWIYLLTLMLGILMTAFFMYLYLSGQISYSFDISEYIQSQEAWISHVIGFISSLGLMSIPVYIMTRLFQNTTKKVASEELRYRTLVESTGTLVFSLDQEGVLLSLNSGFDEFLEENRNDFIGKSYKSIIYDDKNISIFSQKIQDLLSLKKAQVFSVEVAKKLKGVRILSVILTPVIEDGQIDLILGTAMDITELKEAEAQITQLLESRNQELQVEVEARTAELKETYNELLNQEKMASLGRLVAGVAHEINTPVGVSVTAASYLSDINKISYESLCEGNFTKDDLLEYMKNIDESTDIINQNLLRAANLVNNFKKISVDRSVEMPILFNVKSYLEDLMITLRHEYKNKNIKIIISGDEEIDIKSHPGVFSQIFTNLLMNSLVHGFESRKEGNIRIELERQEEMLRVVYSDDGKGMNQEVSKKVFEPFFTTKRHEGGSGLGMHIVFNLVTVGLNGTITLGEKIEKGVKFIIDIPIEGGEIIE